MSNANRGLPGRPHVPPPRPKSSSKRAKRAKRADTIDDRAGGWAPPPAVRRVPPDPRLAREGIPTTPLSQPVPMQRPPQTATARARTRFPELGVNEPRKADRTAWLLIRQHVTADGEWSYVESVHRTRAGAEKRAAELAAQDELHRANAAVRGLAASDASVRFEVHPAPVLD